jgi:hypothetical protein
MKLKFFPPFKDEGEVVASWGEAQLIRYPLMLAPLNTSDTTEIADAKMDMVARYIELFCVRRAVNFRKFAASSIRYTMYSLVKEIRNKDLPALQAILAGKVKEMDCPWDGFADFYMHGQNRWFVKFLLSRISAHINQGAGIPSNLQTYLESPGGKPFEIEHIWADNFNAHTDEFTDKEDFQISRNSIGALILLPHGTNQSYSAKPYEEKLAHYQKENLLARSLCPIAYQNNPNFTKWAASRGLKFQPSQQFKKKDIVARQALYKDIWAFPKSGELPA